MSGPVVGERRGMVAKGRGGVQSPLHLFTSTKEMSSVVAGERGGMMARRNRRGTEPSAIVYLN